MTRPQEQVAGPRLPELLVISPFAGSPQSRHAGGLFVSHQLRRLSERFALTVVCPACEDERHLPDLAGVRVVRVPVAERRTAKRIRDYVAFVTGGLGPGRPARDALRQGVAEVGGVRRYVGVLLQFHDLLPLVPELRSGMAAHQGLAVVTHDVVTQALRRRVRGAGLSWRTRVEAALRLPRVRRREPALVDACDAVWVQSRKDEVLLRQLGATGSIELLPPAVRIPRRSSDHSRRDVAFVADFGREENRQGLAWFLTQVWPRVELPGARLLLIGRGAPPAASARGSGEVVTIGEVLYIDAPLLTARASVAPVFVGAGVKFKVPEALAFGLPVLTTPVGAEGLPLPVEAALALVSVDPAAWAAELDRLLEDPERARRVGGSGRAAVERCFDFDGAVDRLGDLFDRPDQGSSSRSV